MKTLNPLAGPANRAGRIAGEHAAHGNSQPMGGVLGTSIVRIFETTVGMTGLNEKYLNEHKVSYRTAIVQATNHASYFPGASNMQLKVLYEAPNGRILGAQGVGGEGVDKRIDVLATAMTFGGTVYDLAKIDLAYAPPYGSAKDPIHMIAFTAINDLQGHPRLLPPDTPLEGYQVVDVRTAKEQNELPLPGSVAIPIDELPNGSGKLDPKLPTVVVCHSGKRAHIGACRLQASGFSQVFNLTGGMSVRSQIPSRS
jgi:rhodanese-related sulfurtransferase